MLRDAADALSGVDPDDARRRRTRSTTRSSPALVERGLFELTEVREHEWNPLAHNPGPLLHALLARPFAPADERLTSLGGRLAAIPDALATARAVLRDVPRIHAETAIGQFAGTAALIRDELPGLLAEAPGLRAAVEPAAAAALAALDEFDGWLRGRLDSGEPGRDPRLGRPLWEARLWHTLDTELPAAEVLARRRAQPRPRSARELREAAAELVGGPADRRDGAPGARPRWPPSTPTTPRSSTWPRSTMAEATDFVREHDLRDPGRRPVRDRGDAGVRPRRGGRLLRPAGPAGDRPTCRRSTASRRPRRTGRRERVESFYREYNDHMIRNLTVHEAMPGHFLQLAHSRRFRADTRVRALGWSGPFVEGWAVYAEELMAGLGFGGLPVRLQQLKMQLRMSHQRDPRPAGALRGPARGRGDGADDRRAASRRRARRPASGGGRCSPRPSSRPTSSATPRWRRSPRPARSAPPRKAWHDAMLAHGSPPPAPPAHPARRLRSSSLRRREAGAAGGGCGRRRCGRSGRRYLRWSLTLADVGRSKTDRSGLSE